MKCIALIIGILFSTICFGQNTEAKKVAELYLKMLVNVDGNAEKEYRKYSLPIDQEKVKER